MKKYLILLLLPLAIWACNPKSSTSTSTSTPSPTASSSNVTFDATPPGEIKWTGTAGRSFTGTFDRWKFNSFELPDGDYTKVKAEIAVDIASVNVNPDGLENHLRADDYLDAKGHPIATIKLNGATKEDDGSYTSQATVELKGIKNDVEIYFFVDGDIVKGLATLLRQNHEVGDDKGVKNEVPITFSFNPPK